MPNYTVHYFMVKPTHIPSHAASTGSSETVSPASPQAQQIRTAVLTRFERQLQELFQRSAPFRPNHSQELTVRVNRIPEVSPGVPNFSGQTVAAHEPIVYLVTRRNSLSTASTVASINRRASLVMFEAIDGNFQEIPSSVASSARQNVIGDPQGEAGKGIHMSDYAPAVAEVFSDVRMSYEATNWQEIQALTLANLAFHEIAHCKCECTNRGSGNWQAAISGEIHAQSGVQLCSASPAWHYDLDDLTDDYRLMGRHMMVPIPFYKLDMPIEDQFHHHGQSVRLTPVGQASSAGSSGAGGSSSGSSGGSSSDPLSEEGLGDALADDDSIF